MPANPGELFRLGRRVRLPFRELAGKHPNQPVHEDGYAPRQSAPVRVKHRYRRGSDPGYTRNVEFLGWRGSGDFRCNP